MKNAAECVFVETPASSGCDSQYLSLTPSHPADFQTDGSISYHPLPVIQLSSSHHRQHLHLMRTASHANYMIRLHLKVIISWWFFMVSGSEDDF